MSIKRKKVTRRFTASTDPRDHSPGSANGVFDPDNNAVRPELAPRTQSSEDADRADEGRRARREVFAALENIRYLERTEERLEAARITSELVAQYLQLRSL